MFFFYLEQQNHPQKTSRLKIMLPHFGEQHQILFLLKQTLNEFCFFLKGRVKIKQQKCNNPFGGTAGQSTSKTTGRLKKKHF